MILLYNCFFVFASVFHKFQIYSVKHWQICSFFLTKRSPFNSVTSASFKWSGNKTLVIDSLKSLSKTLTVVSVLDFSIFGGIFSCIVAFLWDLGVLSLIQYHLMTLVRIQNHLFLINYLFLFLITVNIPI